MIVHFVCVGNTYRSRLAEALLNARGLPGVSATSSGIRAAENANGPVSWYALRLLKNNGLIPFMSPRWTQTTADVLASADLVVCMGSACHRHCREHYGFVASNYEVWDVPDVNEPGYPDQQADPGDEQQIMRITERTFERLQREVEALAERLRHQAPAVIETENGRI